MFINIMLTDTKLYWFVISDTTCILVLNYWYKTILSHINFKWYLVRWYQVILNITQIYTNCYWVIPGKLYWVILYKVMLNMKY